MTISELITIIKNIKLSDVASCALIFGLVAAWIFLTP